MVLASIKKTPAYYSRFQVKKRRRREGKTDYQQRRNLLKQRLDKYNTKKYRFVVRFTNSRVICQIVYSTIAGDKIVTSADSSELVKYGMPVGLTNYAAAYSTGLLCARRCLAELKLDSALIGKTEADGQEYHIEDEESERKPFKCIFDLGLVRTTTGNKVFGALKGAVDGGLHIPHSIKRFPGYNRESGEYNAEENRKRIFAVHVAEYMDKLKQDDPEKYNAHFAHYIKAGITSENLVEKIKAVHDAIRKDPSRQKVEKKQVSCKREGNFIITTDSEGKEIKYFRPKRLTRAQRMERLQLKIAEVARLATAAMSS